MYYRKGFTLVEVIIVVAIIAILASIIMPKMQGARGNAALNACKGNLRHIGVAMEMYANDNRGYPTPCTSSASTSYDGSYLVTGNYLKSIPVCSLGNAYRISVSRGTAWYSPPPGGSLSGSVLVFCEWNNSGVGTPHQGTGGHVCSPYYWVGGKVEI